MICRLAETEEMRTAIREEISPALFDALGAGLQRLLVEGQRVAVLDQWCLRGRTLMTAVTYVDRNGVTLDAVRSTLDEIVPARDVAEELRFFGGGRANPAQPVIDRLIENIRRGGGSRDDVPRRERNPCLRRAARSATCMGGRVDW
jgi:hypothetical protein